MATPPDQLPLLVEALATHDVALGSRIQPDGSDMRKTQPRYRRMLGKVFHLLASVWVVGPVQDTQCGFKGFTPRRRAGPVRAPADPQHRLRRRADLPRPQARLRRRDRADPLERPARLADAARGPASPLRVAWDLFRIPLIHRRVARRVEPRRSRSHRRPDDRAAAVRRPGDDRPHPADRRDRDVRRRRRSRGARRRAAARATTSRPTSTPPSGCSTAAGSTTRRSNVAGGFAIYLYPPPFAVAFIPFALLAGGRGRRPLDGAAGRRGRRRPRCSCRSAARSAGSIVLLAALRLAGPLLDQARPGRPDPAAAVRDRLALDGSAGRAWRASIVAGGVTKLQPLALAGWALLTGRVRAAAYVAGRGRSAVVVASLVARAVGRRRLRRAARARQRAGDDAAQLHAGRGRVPGRRARGGGLGDPAGHRGLGGRRGRSSRSASPTTRRRTWSRSSPPSSSRRCSGTTTRSCSCCRSPGCSSAASGGRALLPLATALPVLGIVPAAVYPIEFAICLVAPILVGRRAATSPSTGRMSVAMP